MHLGGRNLRFSGIKLPEKRRQKGESDSSGFRFLRYSISRKRNCYYEVWLPEAVFLEKRKNIRSKEKLGGVLFRVSGVKRIRNGHKLGDRNTDGLYFYRYQKSRGKNYEVWYPEEGFQKAYKKQLEGFRQRYSKNPERHRKRLRTERRNNPVRFKEYAKRFYKKNRTRILLKEQDRNRQKPWNQWLFEKALQRKKGKIGINPSYLDKLLKKQKGRCFWTDVPMWLEGVGRVGQTRLFQVSVDRVDNNLGYVKGNCVLSSLGANLGRGAATQKTWKTFLKELGVVKWRKYKNKRQHKEPYKYWDSRIFAGINNSSKIRDHSKPRFKKEILKNLLKKQDGLCYWSKIKMDLTGPYDPYNPFKLSVERLDNSQPYSEGNMVLVCMAMNKARNTASEKEFSKYLSAIRLNPS